ncbi:hypothetical protein SK128_022026, partial [Halocaridina rubra]
MKGLSFSSCLDATWKRSSSVDGGCLVINGGYLITASQVEAKTTTAISHLSPIFGNRVSNIWIQGQGRCRAGD